MLIPPNGPHNPVTCEWVHVGRYNKEGLESYVCQHGWTSIGHPPGKCNKPCCVVTSEKKEAKRA